MVDDEGFVFRVDWWKPAGEDRITPCEKDDARASEARIEVWGPAGGIARMTVPKQGVSDRNWRSTVEDMVSLMRRSFEQGRSHQQHVIMKAIGCRR